MGGCCGYLGVDWVTILEVSAAHIAPLPVPHPHQALLVRQGRHPVRPHLGTCGLESISHPHLAFHVSDRASLRVLRLSLVRRRPPGELNDLCGVCGERHLVVELFPYAQADCTRLGRLAGPTSPAPSASPRRLFCPRRIDCRARGVRWPASWFDEDRGWVIAAKVE